MPAKLSYFDQDTNVSPPGGYLEPVPLTLGPNWVQNDVRMLLVAGAASSSGAIEDVAMTPDPPTGFTSPYSPAPGFGTEGVHFRRLVNGDADTSLAWPKPPSWRYWFWAVLTARGVDPANAPIAGRLSITSNAGDGFCTISSVTVPAAGDMLFFLGTTNDLDDNWPSWPTAIGVPTGWLPVCATDKSGSTFYQYDTNPAVCVVGKNFASSGSTGSVTVPVGQGSPAFIGMYVFLRPVPDSSSTAGNTTAIAAAGAASSSSTTNPVSTAGPAVATASAGQAFNGLTGYGLSPVMSLTGLPVTGSIVEWTSNGLPYLVETTINGGASWDTAINGQPVPRLIPGDTATLNVQMRVSASRATSGSTSPKLTYLRLAVTDDASTVEMVPVGHGVVDKVNRKRATTGGSSGGGSGAGTVGKGGGSSGGGKSLKVHCTDLSKLVSANPWGSAFAIQTGENYVDAAVRMLLNRLPTQTRFRVCTTTKLVPEPFIYGLNQGTDPWKDLREFLAPAGLECFFDAEGYFVIRQIPDPKFGVPVWTIDDDAHPVITDLSEELTTEQTFNYITVKGQGTSTKNAVSAVAFDDNPASPTYILGDFGTRAVTITLPGLESNDQAQIAANAILAGSLSGSQVITISMVPNPALEAGDLIRLDVEDTDQAGIYLINGSTWSPSQADSMQLICARQTAAV